MAKRMGLTIGFAVFLVILLILSVWGVFAIGKRVFKPSSSNVAGVSTSTRPTYEKYIQAGNGVQLEVQGAVKGEEEFKLYKITITPSERKIQLIRGYDGSVEKEESFANTQEAYEVFMRSIGLLNFDSKIAGVSDDERGFCPMGRRYVYSVLNSNEAVISRSWATSCGNNGNARVSSGVRVLFEKQIPKFYDYSAGFAL